MKRVLGKLDSGKQKTKAVESSPEPSNSCGFVYDVFLSFRGEDTRKGFTSHLYRALQKEGIHAFIDSEGLEKGGKIEKLFSYIEDSAVFIPIFSKRYAESGWCLKEIARIVECKRKILPVFFDVEPTDVKHQTGSFSSMSSLRTKEEKTLHDWKEALSEAANCSGYVLEDYNGHESKLIDDIVQELLREVSTTSLHNVAAYPVGMADHLSKMTEYLVRINEVHKVCFIGIWGRGGLGKTSIAKATFNKFRLNFQHSAFLVNVRERASNEDGLVQLQNSLMSSLFRGKSPRIDDKSAGIELMKRRTKGKRILVILDDVSTMGQVDHLVGDGCWLDKGSRIIITTRDKGLLKGIGILDCAIYTPNTLTEDQSWELFSHFAYRGVPKQIEEHDIQLAKDIVNSIVRLPLVLQVLGCHFATYRMEKWGPLMEVLKKEPLDEVQKILRISYDALDLKEKQIFLDIACLFSGKNKEHFENAIHMWEACKFVPELCFEALEKKSLLERKSNGEFQIHDELRDMAREIVRQEDQDKPWARSRVWESEDIMEGMRRCDQGSGKVEALLFNPDMEGSLTANYMSGMSNLRLLIGDNSCHSLDNHKLEYRFPPNTLQLRRDPRPEPKWLRWCHYSYETLPQEALSFHQLVVLELPYFQAACLNLESSGIKKLPNLKVLDFHNSKKLASAPDFTRMPQLKKLIFKDCSNLKEIGPSIGGLKKLVELDLGGCIELEKLPDEISQCSALKLITLDSCTKLSSISVNIGGRRCDLVFPQ